MAQRSEAKTLNMQVTKCRQWKMHFVSMKPVAFHLIGVFRFSPKIWNFRCRNFSSSSSVDIIASGEKLMRWFPFLANIYFNQVRVWINRIARSKMRGDQAEMPKMGVLDSCGGSGSVAVALDVDVVWHMQPFHFKEHFADLAPGRKKNKFGFRRSRASCNEVN